MATLVTRTTDQPDGTTAKGSELTHAEVDANFINLNSDKVEVSGAIVFAAKAGEALTKGDVVYVSGVSGNEPVVSKADADDASKMPAFGLAEADANLNAAVNVVTFGTIYDLDTSGFTAGDTVYVSTTAGSLTATKPAGEASLIQNMGKVIRSHASAGSIKVGGAGRSNDTPNLNDGNVFIGNSSNQTEARALVEADISDFGTYLTAEADTLDTVTGRGATTTNSITTGALIAQDTTNINTSTNFDTKTAPLAVGDHSGSGQCLLIDGNQIEQAVETDRIYLNYNSGAGLSLNYGGGDVSVGSAISTVDDSLSLANNYNLSWPSAANSAYPNIFREASSAALVMASGYKHSATSNKMASSVAASWAKTAVWCGHESIRFYADAASADAVGTDLTPTERMRITKDGRLGVGEASPTSKLHITGSNGAGSRIHIESEGSGTQTFNGSGSGLLMTAGGMNTTSKFTPSVQFGSTDPQLTTTNPKVGAAINAYATETYSADTDGGMGMVFYTRPNNDGTDQDVTERMRITEAGSVCIGDEDPDYNGPRSALYVCSEHNNTGVSSNTYRPDIFVGASSTAGGSGAGGEIRFGSRVYGTSGFAALKGYITNGTANYNVGHLDLNMRADTASASMTRRFRFEYDGDFHADGNVIAYSTTVSDVRLKDDVQDITGALDTVDALRGVTYTWNAGSREGKRDYGVIAQEVEQVIPEIVHDTTMPLLGDEETVYKTVDYEKLCAVLINAVSELRAEVEALKNGASE